MSTDILPRVRAGPDVLPSAPPADTLTGASASNGYYDEAQYQWGTSPHDTANDDSQSGTYYDPVRDT